MKKSKSKKIGITTAMLIAGAFACSSAFANPDAQLPEKQTQGDVSYVTGGVGQDEATAMEKAKSKYSLSLEFAQRAKPRDEYIANVEVTVTDKSGNVVLNTTSDGPYLLADLPNGKYTVSAVAEDGKSIVKHVTVSPSKPEHLILVWS
jgi:hypothetical protein